jgi:hypothetical protein
MSAAVIGARSAWVSASPELSDGFKAAKEEYESALRAKFFRF